MSGFEDLKSLEAQLAGLRPRAAVDRDRLMFLAGTAAARARRRWAWPAATAGMTALAASLVVALLVRPQPQPEVQIVERVVEVPAQGAPTSAVSAVPSPIPIQGTADGNRPSGADTRPLAISRLLPAASYPRVRDEVLTMGIDAWPAQRSAARESQRPPRESYREWRESLLGLCAGANGAG